MFNEIFNVMKCFPKSYITQFGELILSDKGNVYFTAKDCNTQKDIICKLLEWCSRPIAKGEPYRQEKRNKEWRESHHPSHCVQGPLVKFVLYLVTSD